MHPDADTPAVSKFRAKDQWWKKKQLRVSLLQVGGSHNSIWAGKHIRSGNPLSSFVWSSKIFALSGLGDKPFKIPKHMRSTYSTGNLSQVQRWKTGNINLLRITVQASLQTTNHTHSLIWFTFWKPSRLSCIWFCSNWANHIKSFNQIHHIMGFKLKPMATGKASIHTTQSGPCPNLQSL